MRCRGSAAPSFLPSDSSPLPTAPSLLPCPLPPPGLVLTQPLTHCPAVQPQPAPRFGPHFCHLLGADQNRSAWVAFWSQCPSEGAPVLRKCLLDEKASEAHRG